MVGDFYGQKWQPNPLLAPTYVPDSVSQFQFEQLRKEVLDMKELLKRALDYDKRNSEPHCEQEDKIKFLRQVAESVGVSLDDLFGKKE